MNLFEQIQARASNPETRIDMTGFSSKEPLSSVLSIEQINQIETELGFPLPDILKQCYLHIGNGGFGPGYGLLPLIASKKYLTGEDEESVLSFSKEFISCEFSFWEKSCIPLVHWGCGIYSFMDLAQPEKNIVIFDGNNFEEDVPESGVFETTRNLQSFLEAWVNDVNIWEEMFN